VSSVSPDIGTYSTPVPTKAKHITLLLALSAIPLWFVVATLMSRGCVLLYEGGNITQCAGGLSEEEMTVVSGLITLAVQLGLIILAVYLRAASKARTVERR
jgi:hypothetical protein